MIDANGEWLFDGVEFSRVLRGDIFDQACHS